MSYDGYSKTASTSHDSTTGDAGKGDGGIMSGTEYFDANKAIVKAQNGYTGNGHAPQLPLNTWSNNIKWNCYSSCSGTDIKYLRFRFSTGNSYSQPPIKIRNFKLWGQLYSNSFYNINISKSDNYGIRITKYAVGNQTESYFASNGIVITDDVIRVTNNNTYTVYVEDLVGNKKISTITINKIDKSAPTCVISGNPTSWAKSATLTTTGTDEGGSGVSSVVFNGTTSSSKTVTANGSVSATVMDNAGNKNTCSVNVSKIDTVDPTVSAYSGKMLYKDPNFASGNNSIAIYNNSGNGTVTHTRTSGTTPEGSNYLKIVTNGTASPGLGGFTFYTYSSANKVYVTRIVAKIPKGYNINWATNAYGTGGSNKWLTSQAGTGTWQEYIHVTNCGSSGSFSTTNYFYLSGTAATSSNPIEWDVAYATVLDTNDYDSTYYVISAATDNQSGIKYYGLNQSTTAPTYTTLTVNGNVGKINKVAANGTYYTWYKDASGRENKATVSVSKLDNIAPTGTISISVSGGNILGTVSATDSGSGVASYMYALSKSNSCPSSGYTESTNNSYSFSLSGVGTYYICVKIKDKVGNISNPIKSSAYTISDTTRPTCSLSVSGTTITGSYSDSGGSGVAYYGWNSSMTGTSSATKTINATGTYTFYVKDGAGNSKNCSLSVVATTSSTDCSSWGNYYCTSWGKYYCKSSTGNACGNQACCSREGGTWTRDCNKYGRDCNQYTTTYSCASGYTKASNSYCYKIN